MLRTVHLKLPGLPTPAWTDAHASDPAQAPFLITGSAARLLFLHTNLDGDAVVNPTGLTAIVLEIYKDRSCREAEILIAPSGVSLDASASSVTLEQWNAGTHYHFKVDLTGAQTAAAAASLDTEAAVIDAWMELRGQLSGERCFLGAGPVRLHRGAVTGTPESAVQYYTKAEVDGLIATHGATLTDNSASGYGTLTVNGTTLNFPTVTP